METLTNASNEEAVLRSEAEKEKPTVVGRTSLVAFLAYLVGFFSLFTLAVILVLSLWWMDAKWDFQTMTDEVRQHYQHGKMVKVELGPHRQPIKIFVREEGSRAGESVVLVHGLGSSSFLYRHVISHLVSRGIHVVAFDLPGSGFSERLHFEDMQVGWGMFSSFSYVQNQIKDKGLLWGFEQLFETGSLPECGERKVNSERQALDFGVEELAQSIQQVMDLLEMSAAHMVLHDTGVEGGSTWAGQNPSRVQSITLIDTVPLLPSFPVRFLGMPGIGMLITWSSFLHWLALRGCCARSMTTATAEAHAFLLRIGDGRLAAFDLWNRKNMTFDLVASMERLKEVPLQLLWAHSWSRKWQEQGKLLAAHLPHASYSNHQGSRWPQEDAAAEIAEAIGVFVSSSALRGRPFFKEHVAGHIQEMSHHMVEGLGHEHHNHLFCSHIPGDGHHKQEICIHDH